MLGRLRGLFGRPGPVGAVALGAVVGLATGLLALNAVLAGWTFRNASRRDLRNPGRWALAVLVAGPVAFGPYVAVQWYRDRQRDAEPSPPDEEPDDRVVVVADADEPEGTSGAGGAAGAGGATVGGDEASPDGDSLAGTALRYGGTAAMLGARAARWAGRRVAGRMNND